MGVPPVDGDELKSNYSVWLNCGRNYEAAARELDIPRSTLRGRIRRAEQQGIGRETGFAIEALPDELPDPEDLWAERERKFQRKSAAKQARKLVRVKINMDGPIGIVHFGDPHVDDDGTDLSLLREHASLVNNTEGLFGANVGDQSNNWVGRLARLYAEQSTSAAEAWLLTEHFVRSVDWLYILGGNHDCWSGAGDPLKWITEHQTGVFEPWGVRLNLCFPNGKEVRVNARHDFVGHSQWNTAHGVSKAVQMGWRDHILTCGHKHTSGYQVLKDPATGLISHAIRCGSYKTWDRYAEERGLPDQCVFPAATTIIDPQYADDDPRLVTTLFSVGEGAEFLKWKRSK